MANKDTDPFGRRRQGRSGTSPLNRCCSTGSRTMQEIVSMSERA